MQSRYELARRWYRLKARLLGLDRLAHWDRMAPVGESDERIPYEEARSIVLDCYSEFSPELGAAAGEFFADGYIDGPPRPGKRGGAFCSYTVPSAHPYVMLNYTSRPTTCSRWRTSSATACTPRSRARRASSSSPPRSRSPRRPRSSARRSCSSACWSAHPMPPPGSTSSPASLDGAVAAVFRQIAMNRFEDSVHRERRERGELATDRFGELWLESQSELLGDSVELTDDYGLWWSYIWHFMDTPGYVYAYPTATSSRCRSTAATRRPEQGFVPSYLDLLRAGGSLPPEELGAIVGVDLSDPGFWASGLDLIERQLEAAEAAAAEVEAAEKAP